MVASDIDSMARKKKAISFNLWVNYAFYKLYYSLSAAIDVMAEDSR